MALHLSVSLQEESSGEDEEEEEEEEEMEEGEVRRWGGWRRGNGREEGERDLNEVREGREEEGLG